MFHLLIRELRIGARRKGDLCTILAFFVLIAMMFPFALGTDVERLRSVGAGVIWVSALLASLLSLPRLYVTDFEDGSLEQMVLSVFPLHLIVLSKVLAHWITTGLPIALVGPVLGMQYGLESDELLILCATLLLGTPVLSFIGSAGAALSLGLRGAGALQGVLVLPLYAPLLIFGAGAVSVLREGGSPVPFMSLVGALLCLSVVMGTWATCVALRIALD